jgi:hypothetical protein
VQAAKSWAPRVIAADRDPQCLPRLRAKVLPPAAPPPRTTTLQQVHQAAAVVAHPFHGPHQERRLPRVGQRPHVRRDRPRQRRDGRGLRDTALDPWDRL